MPSVIKQRRLTGGVPYGVGMPSIGTSVEQRTAGLARRSSLLWNPVAQQDLDCEVLGLSFANTSLSGAVAELVESASTSRRLRAVFVNAHVMNSAWADPEYWRTVASAHRRYADGSGLAIAARLAGKTFVDNVNGTDLLPVLAAEAVRRDKTIYLLGGVEDAVQGSAASLARMGFGASVAGAHHGHFAKGSAEEEAIIEAVNRSGASIVLVGMGVPLQDQWIEANAHRFYAPVLIGVGGLFDFYSGRASRAPKLLRTLGLEWTWRLAREPRRMWRRYIVGNFTFLARSLIEAWRPAPAAARQSKQVA